MTSILALITARGGSKSIPKKNIAPVAGKPLITWSIGTAKSVSAIQRVVVSTDDEEIAEISRQWGAELPFRRPEDLARDHSPHIPVLEHAINWFADNQGVHFEYLLLLQPTSPLLIAEDIKAAIEIAVEKNADSVVSVCETFSHPFFLKTIDASGRLHDYGLRPAGYQRKQVIPPVYFENGAIYLVRCDVLMKTGTLFPPETYPYIMPQERSLQIDKPWDLYLANLILNDKKRCET